MWRTSWMSREVIVLPAFIGLVGAWWLSLWAGVSGPWAQALPLLVVAGALLLWSLKTLGVSPGAILSRFGGSKTPVRVIEN